MEDFFQHITQFAALAAVAVIVAPVSGVIHRTEFGIEGIVVDITESIVISAEIHHPGRIYFRRGIVDHHRIIDREAPVERIVIIAGVKAEMIGAVIKIIVEVAPALIVDAHTDFPVAGKITAAVVPAFPFSFPFLLIHPYRRIIHVIRSLAGFVSGGTTAQHH